MRWFPVLLLLAVPAWGQDVVLLDCGQVQFFSPDCVTLAPTVGPQPTPAPPEPLFPPETLATDTPPLMRTLLDDPTPDHARAFLDWQAQRTARMQEVQQLLHTLTRQKGTTP